MRSLIIVAIMILLSGCDKKESSQLILSESQKAKLAEFINNNKSDMIYMPSGTFLMGDFCSEMRKGGAFCSGDSNNKPAHMVDLSAFSISKFKITHENYAYYLEIKGLPPQGFNDKRKDKLLRNMYVLDSSPAILTWVEANDYCGWLKDLTGLKFSLPTEAQWEYSARDKGKYISIATNDGFLRYNKKTGLGENYSTDEDREAVANRLGIDSLDVYFPVDKYPPSPAGLYGMADNGKEWVMDWYDPNWYSISSRKDPQGPKQGVIKSKDSGQYWKVTRGASDPFPGAPYSLTFNRGYKIPEPSYPAGITARCVINEPSPIN